MDDVNEYMNQENYQNYVLPISYPDYLLRRYNRSRQHIQEYKHTYISFGKIINIPVGFDTSRLNYFIDIFSKIRDGSAWLEYESHRAWHWETVAAWVSVEVGLVNKFF